MDLQIDYDFVPNTSYTLTNGLPQAGGSNFEVRILNSLELIRFSSNITGIICVKKLKTSNIPTATYYNITIPTNSSGSARLVNVYGYPLGYGINDGILILSLYQAG